MTKSLIAAVATMILFVACTEDKKETKVEVKQEVVAKVEEAKAEIVAKVEETKKELEEVKAKVEDKVAEVKATLDNPAKEEIVTEVTQVEAPSGEAMFKTCASCHGQKGEKEALGKSQAITGWDKDRVVKALNGYKDGSYGGVMKGIMKPHVETKSNEEIEALAVYISKLN